MTDTTLQSAIEQARALEAAGENHRALNIIRSCYHQVPMSDLASIYATTLCRMGERDDDGIDRLIKAHPTNAILKASRSEMALSDGDYETGYHYCKHRWVVTKQGNLMHAAKCPEWDGEAFGGDLLVMGEQGIGEQVLYASLLNRVENRCIMSVDPRLHDLFRRSFPRHLFANHSVLPHFAHDGQRKILVMDLCALLDVRGNPSSWLVADQHKTDIIRAAMDEAMPVKVKVGLSWFSTRERLGDDKSIPAADLLPMMTDPRIGVVNLQYGDINKDAQYWKANGGTLNYLDCIDCTNDLDGLASLIMACDVVVTCSNTTAHLAGALGKRTILLAPGGRFVLWFWGKEGDRTAWYPSIEILRGPPRKSWGELVKDAIALVVG